MTAQCISDRGNRLTGHTPTGNLIFGVVTAAAGIVTIIWTVEINIPYELIIGTKIGLGILGAILTVLVIVMVIKASMITDEIKTNWLDDLHTQPVKMRGYGAAELAILPLPMMDVSRSQMRQKNEIS